MPQHKNEPIKPHHRMHQTPPHVTAFIEKLLPIARAVKLKWGVPIAVVIAQGAQESFWGQTVKGNAYFGIKGKAPDGGTVKFATHEVDHGGSTLIHDNFRAYKSLEEAADDYGQFLKNNARFTPAFAYSDQPDLFVDHLNKYATDPHYTENLKKIIRDNKLADYDRLWLSTASSDHGHQNALRQIQQDRGAAAARQLLDSLDSKFAPFY